ncbi:helix-turn-helix domain-containing protein, partial [Granulicatella sp. WM01]
MIFLKIIALIVAHILGHFHFRLTLSDKERSQIEILLNEGYTISKIATLLNRHKSTISREIKRGSVLQKQYLYGYKEVLQSTYFSDTA